MGNQVKMVWHHHEPPREPVVAHRTIHEESAQTLERVLVVQNAGAALDADGPEIREVAVAIGPNAMETAQAPRRRFFRVGFVGRVP
jgi:hypothetical protein